MYIIPSKFMQAGKAYVTDFHILSENIIIHYPSFCNVFIELYLCEYLEILICHRGNIAGLSLWAGLSRSGSFLDFR